MKSDAQIRKEMEEVVDEVMKTVDKHGSIGKKEFEDVLAEVMQHVENNTAAEPEEIAAATPKVIDDLPREYGQLSEEARSWEALIGYFYGKYLKELGLFK